MTIFLVLGEIPANLKSNLEMVRSIAIDNLIHFLSHFLGKLFGTPNSPNMHQSGSA
jgi:hypothetical protein